MRLRPIALLALSLLSLPVACGSDGGAWEAELAFCVEENNRYRAMKIPNMPFARSSALESFAAEAAKQDAATRTPHGHFGATQGGGVAFAENMIPWWPLSQYGSVRSIIEQGIEIMYAEGPGPFPEHGHYENIVGPYTELGCGIHQNGDEITVNMDFK